MPSVEEIKQIRQNTANAFGFSLDEILNNFESIADTISQIDTADPAIVYTDQIINLAYKRVPYLEDKKYDEYEKDASLRDRLIEKNIEDAKNYLSVCLALQNDYINFSKLYVDAAIKSLEFFLLDLIHTDEKKAGLYEIPFLDVQTERIALENQIKNIDEIIKTHSTLLEEKTVLSGDFVYSSKKNQFPIQKTKLHNFNAFLSTSLLLHARDWEEEISYRALSDALPDDGRSRILQNTSFMAARRLSLEKKSWEISKNNFEATKSELQGRLLRAKLRELYAKKDICFRTYRANVSRQLAYLQLNENIDPKSSLNYFSILDTTKNRFQISSKLLFSRIQSIIDGLSLYEIPHPFDADKNSNLINYTSEWLMQLDSLVLKHHREISTTMFTLQMSKYLFPDADVLKPVPFPHTHNAIVEIKASALGGTDKGLIRGIAFEYIGTGKYPIGIDVEPPLSVTGNVAGSGQKITLHFGRIGYFDPASEIRPQHLEKTWNGNAVGKWRVSFSSHHENIISDILMHIWLQV